MLRCACAQEIAAGAEPRWFEFNDTLVRSVEERDIPEETFGGEEARPRSVWADAPATAMGVRANQAGAPISAAQVMEKYRNAYLVFYDRVPKRKEPAQAAVAAEAAPSSVDAAADGVAALTLERSGSQVQVVVPSEIGAAIREENMTFFRDRLVYDADYFDFMLELVGSASVSEARETALTGDENSLEAVLTQLATRFVFETLARARAKESLPRWVEVLRKLYKRSVPACAWLLRNMAAANWCTDFFLLCTDGEVRRHVGSLVCLALDMVSTLERSRIPAFAAGRAAYSKRGNLTWPAGTEPGSVSLALVQRMLNLMRLLPEHWKRFDQFFRVLYHYTCLGPQEVRAGGRACGRACRRAGVRASPRCSV